MYKMKIHINLIEISFRFSESIHHYLSQNDSGKTAVLYRNIMQKFFAFKISKNLSFSI